MCSRNGQFCAGTVVQVKTKVSEGLKQVVKAEKTQKKGRLILCIFFLLAAVGFMIIVLIVKSILF